MNAKLSLTLRAALAVLLAVMLAVMSAGTARADVNLNVTVTDCATGQPISGAKVNVPTAALKYGSASQATANDKGVANVNPLRTEGKHKIEVSAPGYHSKTVEKDFPAWTTQQVNICLDPTGPTGSQGQKNPGSPKTIGDTKDSTGTGGDPVSTSIGEYYFSQSLLDLGGPLSLQFTLQYAASMDKSPALHNDPFGGDNFSHNWHIALQRVNDTTVVVFFGGGELVNFQKGNDAKWQVIGEAVAYQLQESTNHYWLFDPLSQLVYIFSKATVANRAVGVLTCIQDRNGNALAFTNDAAGRVTRVDDGLGRALTFTYANPTDQWNWLHLASVTDTMTRTVRFGYQVKSEPVLTTHLTSVTNALGATTVFTHTGPLTNTVVSGRILPRGNSPYTQQYTVKSEQWSVVSQTDALGNVTRFATDAEGVTKVTDPLGNSQWHVYDDKGRLIAVEDAAGKKTTFEYDAQGRRTAITDRLGNVIRFTYHPETGKLSSIADVDGSTTAFIYSPQTQTFASPTGDRVAFTFYNLTRIDYPDKSNTQYTYDEKGHLLTRVDRAGKTWAFTYNERGQTLTETNPTGGKQTYTYNPNGTLASSSDSDIGTTTYGYDAFKRMATITHPDKTSIKIAYDADDQTTSVTDEQGNAVKFAFDANGNLVTVTDASGKATLYAYDVMDRWSGTTDRLGKRSSRHYDAWGNLTAWTDPNGNTIRLGYDANGWLTQKTDAAGKVWKIGYDAEGNKISRTTPLGNTTRYERDKVGNLTKTTDPLGNAYSYTWDTMSQLLSRTDPLGRKTQYTYDAAGDLVGMTQPDLGIAAFKNNALGLLTMLSDLRGKNWSFDYTPMGRVSAERDPLGKETQFAYDSRGRLVEIAYPTGESATMTFDSVGNLVRMQAGETEAKYTYDALNRPTAANGIALVYDAEANVTSTQDGAVSFGAAYDDALNLKTVTYNNGAFTVTYTYDQRNLLTQVTDSLTGATIKFTYDDDERPTSIIRSNGITTTYTWDAADRITRIQDGPSTGSGLADQQFKINAAGEVTQVVQTLPLDPSTNLKSPISNLQYDDASQVSSAGYAFDGRGRQTASPSNKFTWDGIGRLTGTGSATLEYNGFSDLMRRKEGNTTTHYYYNHAILLPSIVAEQDEGTGKFLRYYVWSPAGQLLYMIDATAENKVYFYHYDAVGSTLFLTDAKGAVTDSYAYTPYGVLLAHNGSNAQPFTFVGRFGIRQECPAMNSGCGLYHMRARYYDAVTARFLSRDPVFPRLEVWDGLNPYLYARANPLKYVDKEGKAWTVAMKAIWEFIKKYLSQEALRRLRNKIIAKAAIHEAAVETAQSQVPASADLLDKTFEVAAAEVKRIEAETGTLASLLSPIPDSSMAELIGIVQILNIAADENMELEDRINRIDLMIRSGVQPRTGERRNAPAGMVRVGNAAIADLWRMIEIRDAAWIQRARGMIAYWQKKGINPAGEIKRLKAGTDLPPKLLHYLEVEWGKMQAQNGEGQPQKTCEGGK